MKAASIVVLLLGFADTAYLAVWATRRSLHWSVVEANFESDAGKSTVNEWHLEHVRSVGAAFDHVLIHTALVAVLLVVAAILFANRKPARHA
jgi:hypothetical protein